MGACGACGRSAWGLATAAVETGVRVGGAAGKETPPAGRPSSGICGTWKSASQSLHSAICATSSGASGRTVPAGHMGWSGAGARRQLAEPHSGHK